MILTLMLALCVCAMADESKILTVGPEETWQDVQSAIDYISAQTDKNGWTLHVKAGNYGRFTVPVGMEGLSDVGESECGKLRCDHTPMA